MSGVFGNYWRTWMAEKRKIQKLTAEERAKHERHRQMLRDRLAYRETKEREVEQLNRQAAGDA
jgi:hypothetical protein